MMIDEPISASAQEWIRKAIWQARNDQAKGVQILGDMLASHPELRTEIAAVLLRSATRQMLFDDKPMG